MISFFLAEGQILTRTFRQSISSSSKIKNLHAFCSHPSTRWMCVFEALKKQYTTQCYNNHFPLSFALLVNTGCWQLWFILYIRKHSHFGKQCIYSISLKVSLKGIDIHNCTHHCICIDMYTALRTEDAMWFDFWCIVNWVLFTFNKGCLAISTC